MEKEEGRWPDPSTKNTTRLPEGFLPEFLHRKTNLFYIKFCLQ